MMESLKAWLYTPDGLFYLMIAGIYLLCFLGLVLAIFAHYLGKKEKREAKEKELKRGYENRHHSQQKPSSVHHF